MPSQAFGKDVANLGLYRSLVRYGGFEAIQILTAQDFNPADLGQGPPPAITRHDLLDLYDRQRRTVAQEYLQRQTIENKKNLEQKDPEARARFHDELRAIVADPAKLHPYLMKVAMIEGMARAQSIT